jgi:microcystin-dependent protein
MDYPKSVQGVGLVDGKFVNENRATGQVGSLIPAEWGNSVTDEILNVIRSAGLEPSEESVNQLASAIKLLASIGSPTGMIAFIHATDVPEGWLLCNGAAVSRTTYANLFAKIGVTYGSGDGSTTFNLPNLDGRVLQGTTSTSKVGQYLEAQLPNISGGMTMYRGSSGDGQYGAFQRESGDSTNYTMLEARSPAYGAVLNFSASASNSIYSGSSVQTKAISVLACIRF